MSNQLPIMPIRAKYADETTKGVNIDGALESSAKVLNIDNQSPEGISNDLVQKIIDEHYMFVVFDSDYTIVYTVAYEGDFSLVTTNDNGVIRIYRYTPGEGSTWEYNETDEFELHNMTKVYTVDGGIANIDADDLRQIYQGDYEFICDNSSKEVLTRYYSSDTIMVFYSINCVDTEIRYFQASRANTSSQWEVTVNEFTGIATYDDVGTKLYKHTFYISTVVSGSPTLNKVDVITTTENHFTYSSQGAPSLKIEGGYIISSANFGLIDLQRATTYDSNPITGVVEDASHSYTVTPL